MKHMEAAFIRASSDAGQQTWCLDSGEQEEEPKFRFAGAVLNPTAAKSQTMTSAHLPSNHHRLLHETPFPLLVQ